MTVWCRTTIWTWLLAVTVLIGGCGPGDDTHEAAADELEFEQQGVEKKAIEKKIVAELPVGITVPEDFKLSELVGKTLKEIDQDPSCKYHGDPEDSWPDRAYLTPVRRQGSDERVAWAQVEDKYITKIRPREQK